MTLAHLTCEKQRFEFAVGSLAIITALALGAIPLFLSYRPVAFAAPWDLTMFILYSIALGLMRAIFSAPYNLKDNVKVMDPKDPVFGYHWTDMMNYFWVDLAGMLLFLVSAIMGAALVSLFHSVGVHEGAGPGTIQL